MRKKIILLTTSLLVLSGCMEITPTDSNKENENVAVEESSVAGQITEVLIDQALDYVKARYSKSDCSEENTGCESASATSKVEFVREKDGDTIVLRVPTSFYKDLIGGSDVEGVPSTKETSSSMDVTIRFLLIDSSEVSKNEPFSKEAQEFTANMLRNADVIEIEVDQGPREDHYGRLLAYVYADGVSVQEALLAEGLAKIAYVNEPNTRYLEKFKLAEEHAKTNKLGLWGLE